MRLELVRSARWAPEVRAHAWFSSDQAPQFRAWPRAPTNWQVQDGPGLCRDLRDGESIPTGAIDRRAYVDVGEAVTDLTMVTFYRGGPVGVCIGPRSGYITIPWEFLEQMPSGGTVQYGHLHYRAEQHEGRRIDFFGLNAREARYVIDRGSL